MSIISYAQNFEDVMLWRAVGHVNSGFYIDIGAQHPLIDSVSLAFHERGWRGIHVEPTPYYAELLRQQRPNDTIIQAAVGNSSEVIKFYEIPNTGISTADAVIANQHRERGFHIQESAVPCLKLSAIFEMCGQHDIHWLKIDVEGFEQQVLSSWGESAARPWIVVVESTLPLTQIETHGSWEAIIVDYGYSPVYFDGLNRYYVSDAHPEIKGAFHAPPNVFDGFTLNGTASAPFHCLIEARFKEKDEKVFAEFEQQRKSANEEIERLSLSLTALKSQQAEQEHTLVQQLQIAEEELSRIKWEQEKHRQEATTHMLSLQLQAAQEKSEQAHNHNKQVDVLQRQYAEQEHALSQQLRSVQEEVRGLERDLARRDQAYAEQASLSRQELENLLRTLAQREQETATQLLDIQRQALQERSDQERRYSTQECALQNQYAEREHTLRQQLQSVQKELRCLEQECAQREKEHNKQSSQARQELEGVLRTLVQREKEAAAQLLAFQEKNACEKAEQAKNHYEQIRGLDAKHAERELALLTDLRTLQDEFRNLERVWSKQEQALNKEIYALQSQAQALQHTQQMQAQKHESELRAGQEERSRLMHTHAALEAQLREQLIAEQQTVQRFQAALACIQHALDAIHASLSWRMTLPLRKLAVLFASQATAKPLSAASVALNLEHSALNLQLSHSPQQSLVPIMLSTTHMTNTVVPPAAVTLDELLAYHDQQFVFCAYRTLLGREPDPEGMRYYLLRIRKGIAKLHILKQLRMSSECVGRTIDLPELDRAILQHSIGNIPLIGWMFRLLNGAEGNTPSERKLRSIENQLFVLGEESRCRFTQLGAALTELHRVVEQRAVAVNVAPGKEQSHTGNDASSSLEVKEPEGLKQLSSPARKIYLQLKSAAAAYSARKVA